MMFDPVSDVPAPAGCYGWSVSAGWIDDPSDLAAATADDVVLVADDDQIVRGIEGDAQLASLMHLDRRVLGLRLRVMALEGHVVALMARLQAGDL